MTLELEKSQNIALRSRRGYGSAKSRYEAYEMGAYGDDEHYGEFPCDPAEADTFIFQERSHSRSSSESRPKKCCAQRKVDLCCEILRYF
jgi:hypothetical protein